VVTGAERGLGRAIATLLCRQGAYCIIIALDCAAGVETVEQLRAEGLSLELHAADVSDAGQVEAAAREIAKRHSAIHVLVNNAGVFLAEDRRMSADAIDPAILKKTLAVNLQGTMHVCKALLPLMPRGARIINVSSTMGQLATTKTSYAPAYRASKAALNSYTRSLAAELKARGIMVDCYHPGWVRTDIGGPHAPRSTIEGAQTALYLATRRETGRTGLFWEGRRAIPW
jgi:NAD(P)-dependent dehydrogenase (short-subunit alcohol dehydrogenase family)